MNKHQRTLCLIAADVIMQYRKLDKDRVKQKTGLPSSEESVCHSDIAKLMSKCWKTAADNGNDFTDLYRGILRLSSSEEGQDPPFLFPSWMNKGISDRIKNACQHYSARSRSLPSMSTYEAYNLGAWLIANWNIKA